MWIFSQKNYEKSSDEFDFIMIMFIVQKMENKIFLIESEIIVLRDIRQPFRSWIVI